MTFVQRRNRLTTHFSERIPVVKRRIGLLEILRCRICNFSVHNSVLYTYSTVHLPTNDQYIKQPLDTIHCTPW